MFIIEQIVKTINDWMQSLNFNAELMDHWNLTFHLPIHRYLSVFAFNAIYQYNMDPVLFLPTNNEENLLDLMYFPLRAIVSCSIDRSLNNIL